MIVSLIPILTIIFNKSDKFFFNFSKLYLIAILNLTRVLTNNFSFYNEFRLIFVLTLMKEMKLITTPLLRRNTLLTIPSKI